MQRRRIFSQGFTLIELLVVVAIMGILLAAGVVAFTNAQKSSRDSRRSADMKAVQQAFEQYYLQNANQYASTCSGMAANIVGGAMPTDPKGNVAYSCNATGVVGTTASGYCACAALEQTGKGNATDTSCTFGTGSSANYFCVSQTQ
jgi:type IV pilus assembly protein PilE